MRLASLFIGVALSAGSGCADWFEPDTCGGPYVRIVSSPDMTCLDLFGIAGRNAELDRIDGRNNCSQTLVIGNPAGSYPTGAEVAIPLDEGTASHEGMNAVWMLSGTLGTEAIAITATKSPC